MAKAKLYKANLNWIVKAEGGQQIMGPTPEDATASFQALWAQNYPGEECPEIERDEHMDTFTMSKTAPIPPPLDEAPKATDPSLGRPFTMAELHAALTEGERLQRAYAPAFAHPLLQPNVAVNEAQALEAVRSLEKGLSATSGREVKLL